jgi:hypothetical protein
MTYWNWVDYSTWSILQHNTNLTWKKQVLLCYCVWQTYHKLYFGDKLKEEKRARTRGVRRRWGLGGGLNLPEILKFWQSSDKLPVPWKIYPWQPNQNTGFTHFQIEWNPWLGGYRPQIPVLSALCPQLNLLTTPLPEKKFLGTPLVRNMAMSKLLRFHVSTLRTSRKCLLAHATDACIDLSSLVRLQSFNL